MEAHRTPVGAAAGPDADPLRPLLVRAARGDERAMGDLYDRTCRRAYGWALRILGDPALAEEAMLDAYAQAWRSADRHDPARATVEGWLLMIVRSRSLDAKRAARRHEPPAALAADLPASGGDPAAVAEEHERARRVRAAVDGLPRDQRTVLDAAFFGGMSHSEVALLLGLPLGTVKTRIRAALAGLRGRLATTLEEPA